MYKVRVRYNSFFTTGTFRLAIMAAPDVTSFEDITGLTDTCTQTVTLPQYQAMVYRYNTSITSNRTIRTTSSGADVDTHIYVVYPNSAVLMSDDSYNDNYNGSMFAQITKNMENTTNYLIIISSKTLSIRKSFNISIS